VKSWHAGDAYLRNADSCVSCHNVPMPGGSGMSVQSMVRIDPEQSPGSREEIVQEGFPVHGASSEQTERRRTPPLFGIGYLQFAEQPSTANRRIPPGVLGAFGQKRGLRDFIAGAFATELGISSRTACARRATDQSYPTTCPSSISDRDLADVVEYIEFLAPPPRHPRPQQHRGATIFNDAGCAACHTTFQTDSVGCNAIRAKEKLQPKRTALRKLPICCSRRPGSARKDNRAPRKGPRPTCVR
jgi:CxxC motif-containing protein (DUF1111 family)